MKRPDLSGRVAVLFGSGTGISAAGSGVIAECGNAGRIALAYVCFLGFKSPVLLHSDPRFAMIQTYERVVKKRREKSSKNFRCCSALNLNVY